MWFVEGWAVWAFLWLGGFVFVLCTTAVFTCHDACYDLVHLFLGISARCIIALYGFFCCFMVPQLFRDCSYPRAVLVSVVKSTSLARASLRSLSSDVVKMMASFIALSLV